MKCLATASCPDLLGTSWLDSVHFHGVWSKSTGHALSHPLFEFGWWSAGWSGSSLKLLSLLSSDRSQMLRDASYELLTTHTFHKVRVDILEIVCYFGWSIENWHICVDFILYIKFRTLQNAFFVLNITCGGLHIKISNTSVSIVLSRYSIFFLIVFVLMVVENDCLSHNCYLFHKIQQGALLWCFFDLREISHTVVSSVLFSYFIAEIISV